MSVENTLSIIKPDAVLRGIIGKIEEYFECNGLKIIAMKMLTLSREQAEKFYIEHSNKLFYSSLVNYMISGPIVVQILQGENAVLKNREIMGATNPKFAVSGTIRSNFALSVEKNSVHGSDSIENAEREINFFFQSAEISQY